MMDPLIDFANYLLELRMEPEQALMCLYDLAYLGACVTSDKVYIPKVRL